MTDRIKGIVAALAAVAALAVGGAAIAGATGNDSSSMSPSEQTESENGPEERGDSEASITGSALEKAGAAALESTGGGQVTETETGDEESYYEVEVSRDDGSQVDVQLDRQFNVVGSETDGSGDE
jgi:uncharacterized membrane protein YkoI